MKNIFYTLVACLLFCITSCTDYNNGYNENEITFNEEFYNEFNFKYTGQTWGFGNSTVVDIREPQKTRTVLTNLNEWYSNYKLQVPGMPHHLHGNMVGTSSTHYTEADVPENDNNWVSNNVGNPVGDVTQEERDYVYKWFSENHEPQGIAIHWSDFFIQYVNAYNEVNAIGGQAGRYMDYLGYESMNGTWEHVNNFNVTTHAMQYVRDAGTENWTYRSSFDDKYHNDRYVIEYLVFDIPQTDCPYGCTNHHYEGWYVAFDYEGYVYEGDGSLRSGSVFADGYYNDWIVKVSPGLKQDKTPGISQRIMCEDLGNSFDWDYNDVVFDVSYEQDWTGITAIITLQAAGGTMGIYVGTTDTNYEAHKLFNVSTNTVVIRPTSPAIYRVPVTSTNPKDIDITVVNKGTAVYVLKAESTPQKFCCPAFVDWSDELKDIRLKYPKWEDWVKDNSVKFWQ